MSSQSKYILLEKDKQETPDVVKQKLKEGNYRQSKANFTNGFAVITKRNKKKEIIDKEGNILDKEFGFVTSVTKKGMFFSGTPILSSNDYGAQEEAFYKDIKAYNINGEEVDTEVSKNPNFYFSSNQVKSHRFYSSTSDDYLTFHETVKEVNEAGKKRSIIREGLMNGEGKIILKPIYEKIIKVYEDYFLVTEKNKDFSKIINVKQNTVLPLKVDSFLSYRGMNRHKEIVIFNDKIILKSQGKYGIYNLKKKTWVIENVYDEIKPIVLSKQFDKTKLVMSELLLIEIFKAKKEGSWGVINYENEIVIPFKYSEVKKRSFDSGIYTVSNEQKKNNYYDTTEKKEVFENFYEEIRGVKSGNIFLFKNNGKYMLFDKVTDTFLVKESDGFTHFSYLNQGNEVIFKKQNTKSQYPKQLVYIYSIKNKKMLLEEYKFVSKIDWSNKFVIVGDLNNKKSIYNMNKETFLVSGSFLGRGVYRNNYIGFYSGGKKKLIACYSTVDGARIKPKKCYQ